MKIFVDHHLLKPLMQAALLTCGILPVSLLAVAQTKPVPGAQNKTVATAKSGSQAVKPPIAMAYIDLATSSSDMPGGMMGAMQGGQSGGFLGALGGMARGSSGGNDRGNVFGNTHTMGFNSGKYMDVSVFTSKNTSLTDATQMIPAGMNLGDSLKLLAPPPDKPVTYTPVEETPSEPSYEKPKGKISIYWGCGETVRPGQPRTLDAATATPEDFAKFFVMRGKVTKGARSQPGNPAWPNKNDDRKVPDSASLVGQHQFTGTGIPESFKLNLAAANDLMAPIELTQTKRDGGVSLEWKSIPNARGYFISVMGGQQSGGRDSAEMIVWTSSELADFGFGLVDYQSNADVDKWINEKVILSPTTTKCDVPKGIFGDQGSGMLRMIAYGNDAYFAYPPRPSDPKIAWEPDWQTKLRVKSTYGSILGGMGDMGGRNRSRNSAQAEQQRPEQKEEPKVKATDVLKGILGF
ncbi:hypothetical protein [Undibacterium sp. TS12]|uniref:hypothetical protein n=1 Tax=Undibacterium sp. TS12 TaxID=2908202 RepID=UPI001F4CEE6E|nr:hypothetical protein [Undibacterium sp. TS12]MCH8618425.1 hypothetical protein [Undibacterium sp. TS12]